MFHSPRTSCQLLSEEYPLSSWSPFEPFQSPAARLCNPPAQAKQSNRPTRHLTTTPARPTAPSQQAKSPLGAAQTQLHPLCPRDSVRASSCDSPRAQHGGGPSNCLSRSIESRTRDRRGTRCPSRSRFRSPLLFLRLLRACGRWFPATDRRRNPTA